MTSIIVRARRKLLQHYIGRLLVRRHNDALVRLGSDYGGWWVPSLVLKPGTTVISAGVGEDTTFDEALLSHGCTVWALDPTPRACDYVRLRAEAGALNGQFHFYPVGLWHRDETLRFYAPVNPVHVSHSILNVQATNSWFEAECWSLAHLLQTVNLRTIDVLKMDIEGAEINVLFGMLASPLRPRVICVELDSPLPEWRTLQLLRALRASGYRLAYAEGWNLVFLYATAREVVPS